MQRPNVVLPEPLSPTRPNVSPRSTVSEALLHGHEIGALGRAQNTFVRFRTSSSTVIATSTVAVLLANTGRGNVNDVERPRR